jgi:hypothetical protein
MLNMVLFLFLMNFLSALMAIQLLRGDLYEDPSELINFSQTYNSFLGMYQIFSTENWTTILYNSVSGWVVNADIRWARRGSGTRPGSCASSSCCGSCSPIVSLVGLLHH